MYKKDFFPSLMLKENPILPESLLRSCQNFQKSSETTTVVYVPSTETSSFG